MLSMTSCIVGKKTGTVKPVILELTVFVNLQIKFGVVITMLESGTGITVLS